MKAAVLPESLPIAVRGYASKPSTHNKHAKPAGPPPIGPSEWTLTFDTETTTDAAQQRRVGAYQLRRAGVLLESGFFYDPLSLEECEQSTLFAYAKARSLAVLTLKEFVEEVFFPYVYERRGLCIGFNLPFDLSRLAISHSSARKQMRGGFSLQLSENKQWPRVQIKHLNSRSALIRFAAPRRQKTPSRMRKRGQMVPVRRGHFADVRTLGGALLGGSWSLRDLAEHLKTKHRKLGTDEYGGPLSDEFLKYAEQDVQVTWECFERLNQRYEGYGLTRTLLDKIYSEASLGKAYLKEMGIRPWQVLQSDFPSELLGIIMSTYFGGRSEVHVRREVVQVLYCDFLSMYPTVCTLMGLWRFVIAERMEWQDATSEVQEFLEHATLEDLQKPETWPMLCAVVQVQPDDDIYPVRSKYGDENQYTIGINRLTSDNPLWFTLAECVTNKLQSGKTSKVLQALRFEPVGVQSDLRPINIAGNPDYYSDPRKDDFYKRLIDLRSEVKAKREAAKKTGDKAEAAKLNAEQQALKICANATSYGIFVELNVDEQDKSQEMMCFGGSGKGFPTRVINIEEPGRYFHPLLATLITGAARLILTIAERLAEDSGISWAFCDTDSMALATPKGMDEADFLERAKQVRDWFTPLNPYEHKGPLFKIEDANYHIQDGKITDELEPLYCVAISAKRYALFNIDERDRPVLRKVSAHGLGHLLAAYGEKEASKKIPKSIVPLYELEVERWQYDLWYRVVQAALGDTPEQVRLDDLPGFQEPAVSRYGATTPNLLRWFKEYNRDKPYRDQVKPFNFMLAYQPGSMTPEKAAVNPVSAYDKALEKAVEGCFDRQTSEPVPRECLKSYQEALAQYHLHPEAKFHNGNYLDRGVTSRRHIIATAVEHIGKEANRWEEQFYLGQNLEAQTEYGTAPEDYEQLLTVVKQAAKEFGQRKLAKAAGVALSEVSGVLRSKWEPTPKTLTKLYRAVPELEAVAREHATYIQGVLNRAREHCQYQSISVRKFAEQAGVDGANLAHALSGKRKLGQGMLAKLEVALAAPSPADLQYPI